ncbi:homoserine dehydrogenase [Clostridium sp. BIOML-A1]|jgi:homoserine dehydrogenase|uniref:homoserine dehydrogenase n=1 Tax=Clostridia TaxID=186801 RepID=UPI00015BD17E|nr:MULTISPECIES: homoserine dehydrogenase [unclassified Clostridium]EDO57964.1 homoserine dehydrogenase [Clostridium sp. L2-50]MZH18105.1 homoserine dehydrogenase [Clostridium sp. BIOML-A1]UEA73885.1 homoserine dehydrogenase [Lachnospiraceae bacterium GAM79]UEA77062.1 homoserine dehydrogenase [Lachnospiraceae bacterium GAM79]
MVNIAVLGYGTVGSGVVEVINTNHEIINKRAGEEINIKYVLDLRDFPGDPVQQILTHDFNDILNDDEVKVVVEVMGGINPAYTFVKQCLAAGKSVATSNKELVASHGPELLAIAKENNVNFLFEASVGGGIPIIRPLNTSITADEVTEITGILNGTTNYILTKMDQEGASYDEVLKQAQDLGYAERNPEADVEGGDACRKIAILTSIVYGKHLDYTKIHTEGITKISTEDFKYADALGVSIKLVGTTKKEGDTLYSFVAPMMLDENHPLSGIHDVFNGIFVHGNVVDDIMFYGRGAGKLPTASAVVSDVVDEVKHMGKNIMASWDAEPLPIGDFRDAVNRFFVRVSADSITKEEVQKLFGDVTYVTAEGIDGELAFITSAMTEGSFADAIAKIDKIYSIIRVAF